MLFALLVAAAIALVGRAVDLQLVDRGFLAQQGDARFSRVAAIVAHRGTITDRNGEPLAVSTPVDSVWTNPQELAASIEQLPRLASALGVDHAELTRRVSSNMDRPFLYIGRGLTPVDARRVKALNVPGVYLTREYRRTTLPVRSPVMSSASPASTMSGRRAPSSLSTTGWPVRTARSG